MSVKVSLQQWDLPLMIKMLAQFNLSYHWNSLTQQNICRYIRIRKNKPTRFCLVIMWTLSDIITISFCLNLHSNSSSTCKWLWVKKLHSKKLTQDVFDRKWSLDGLKTLIKISVRDLNLLIFAVGWALCGRPQPKHESMMPLLSLSPLNVLSH